MAVPQSLVLVVTLAKLFKMKVTFPNELIEGLFRSPDAECEDWFIIKNRERISPVGQSEGDCIFSYCSLEER